MKLSEAKTNIGARVVYVPAIHRSAVWVMSSERDREALALELGVSPHIKPEDGTITSVNDRYVFVRYDGDIHSKATDPVNLEFQTKE